MANIGVSSSSKNAVPVLPSEPQALLTGQPETYSVIQNHLQDALRSIGDAVPWSPHQHVATNSEGTKRAHIFASDSISQSHVDNATQPQRQGVPPSSAPHAPQGLHHAMPLQMPRPLATHFPPAQSDIAPALKAGSSLTSPGHPSHILDDRNAQGMGVASLPSQQRAIPAQPGLVSHVSGGPAPFQPDNIPSVTGLQLNGSTSQVPGLSFQQSNVPPTPSPPPVVSSSSMPTMSGQQVCQPVTTTGAKVTNSNVIVWCSRTCLAFDNSLTF